MPLSYQSITNPSSTSFTVSFEFLNLADIKAVGKLNSASEWTELPVTDAATSNDVTTVTVADAGTYSSAGEVRIYRASSQAPLVDFQNGSRLSERDLDTAYRQGLFASQEVRENATEAIAGIGPQGPQGATGPAGVDGADGADGNVPTIIPDNLQVFAKSSNQTISANSQNTITSYGSGQIADRLLFNYGTQYVTHSSGIFSFSTEGYYHVVLRVTGSQTASGGAATGHVYLNSATDGSSFADAIDINLTSASATGGFNAYFDGVFKITDTSNHKLSTSIYMPQGGEVGGGGGSRLRTFIRFVRLGTTA
jgi:hypothetical protein